MNELRAIWLDQPREVSIETLARCNAACTFCPYPTLDRKGTRMSDELLDKLVAELASFTRPVYLSPFKVNEPLLDVRLIPLIERVNREAPRVRVRIFTNGSPLTSDKVEAIARLKNIEHLWVSLNSHIPEEYERLMGLRFDLTARRLDHLHELVGLNEFPHPVVLSTVGFPNEPFRRYCFDRWPLFQSLAIKRDAWIDYTDAQNLEVPDSPCVRWFELSILATGKVAHCCMHDGADEKYNIGDVNNQTMLEIYNSPFWRERREKLLSRRALDERSPCSHCSY